MTRYLFGFLCVCALGLIGCSETVGTGGSGGSGAVGGDGGSGGGGSGGQGGTGGTPKCERAEDCDDKNECTADACNPENESCENTPVEDGAPCADARGGCYGGVCNFVTVSVAFGERELVFDWTADRCEALDIPDGPARAVRGEDGEIVILATHYSGNYLSRGADFGTLERACDPPPLVSTELPAPESYENFEWLWSPYRVGANWHVLIHNEYHPLGPLPCTASKNCWYNSITYAVSTDDAHSFVKPGAPAHTVAPAPRLWVPPPPDIPQQDWYAEGYFAPTNIVRGPDDYYYALIFAIPAKDVDERGLCAIRTDTLSDPTSWRAWDGSSFNLPLPSPYITGSTASLCEFLPSLGRQGSGSLTYNSYIDRYMHVNDWGQWVDPQTLICGFYFTLSTDLIHWSDIQLIARADIGWCADNGGAGAPPILEPGHLQYPSIIDHADSTANFERPGRTPYLYYTRHNGGLDRDLVRVPLMFTLEN